MNKFKLFFLLLILSGFNLMIGQANIPENWHHLNANEEIKGISTEQAHALLNNKPSQTIIVAVIDSGIDHKHEDLDDVMWVNQGEIPNNGIDDDNNGYIDDIHGWSFLGNSNGENVDAETLEETRIYAAGEQYKGDNETFVKAVKSFVSSRENFLKQLNYVNERLEAVELLEKYYPKTLLQKDFDKVETNDTDIKELVDAIKNHLKNGGTYSSYKSNLASAKTFYSDAVNYYYNPEFNGRDIIKDDYSNQNQRYYGNNDTYGPDPSHGTHVAGIIAGERKNGVGMNGIAGDVKIMAIRTVPNGDERDKDVANAIYYAVNNGAKVINMSFGKGFSWNKKIVDDAVRYAQKKDVLLVHAAGNGASELDGTNNFPNKEFEKRRFLGKKVPNNWIEVGAATYNFNENYVASFSNFDNYFVDLFAPGYQIYSTTPGNTYSKFNGTSMASPMVAGVAALLRSYFPKLSAKDVRSIILESATPIDLRVIRPDTKERVPFKTLSVTGAVLNAEAAVKMALKEEKL